MTLIFSISHFLGHTHNFDKKDNDLVETFDLPYDYESLMHYPNNAFAKPGANVTIVSKVQFLIDFFFRRQTLMFFRKNVYSWFKPLSIVLFQIDPNRKLGQFDGPTKYDLEKIRKMYNC